jgi:hypothetical protein
VLFSVCAFQIETSLPTERFSESQNGETAAESDQTGPGVTRDDESVEKCKSYKNR